MKTVLVGYTGFVGSNLVNEYNFDRLYNSKNITEAFGTNPDLLVYSGVPAQKFMANNNPEKDYEIIENAMENIKKINPKSIVLISTIDVYRNPENVDENSVIDTNGLQPYGYDRYVLEKWVSENISNHLIIHLPGLYGENLKKNFIFDLINVIPSILKEEKYNELTSEDKFLADYYENQGNGFFKVKDVDSVEKNKLKEYFNKIGFSALNFTDSRGKYQFYNLKFLWKHIEVALKNNIKVLNLATEPVLVSEIYECVRNGKFENIIASNVPNYDFKTKYDYLFGGSNGYICDKEFVLNDIKEFIKNVEIVSR